MRMARKLAKGAPSPTRKESWWTGPDGNANLDRAKNKWILIVRIDKTPLDWTLKWTPHGGLTLLDLMGCNSKILSLNDHCKHGHGRNGGNPLNRGRGRRQKIGRTGVRWSAGVGE